MLSIGWSHPRTQSSRCKTLISRFWRVVDTTWAFWKKTYGFGNDDLSKYSIWDSSRKIRQNWKLSTSKVDVFEISLKNFFNCGEFSSYLCADTMKFSSISMSSVSLMAGLKRDAKAVLPQVRSVHHPHEIPEWRRLLIMQFPKLHLKFEQESPENGKTLRISFFNSVHHPQLYLPEDSHVYTVREALQEKSGKLSFKKGKDSSVFSSLDFTVTFSYKNWRHLL